MSTADTIRARIAPLQSQLQAYPGLWEMFQRCFMNTIETTVQQEPGDTFVITGDIPAMWLRDSTAQVLHYLRFADEPQVAGMVEGLIARQAECILRDPYANAFNREPSDYKPFDDFPRASDWVWERKYEIDSLCYPVWLAEKYVDKTGSTAIRTVEAGEGKVTFTMPDGGVLVTPAFVPEVPEELPFTDVKEGDWFYDSVAYVYFNGLMNGTSDTTFTPNGTTTRGMIVTILYRLAGSPETAAWSPFQDVDPGQYYAAPIAWAAWNGIVNGKTATAFGPNDPITREQMAAILHRYAKSQGMDVSQTGNLTQFRDQGSISSYAVEALSWANGAGLITGKGEGILDPQGPAVRAQVAAIFQRFCEVAEQ